MREFIIRRLRRAPLLEQLWDEYERMLTARDAAYAERDAAVAARDAALAQRDASSKNRSASAKIGSDEMTNRHFVEEYAAYVRDLMLRYPLDEAMSLAVGGSYDLVGQAELRILQGCGLEDGMSLVDFGCGSGRLAKHFGLTYRHIEYLGVDVVQELLDYAARNRRRIFVLS